MVYGVCLTSINQISIQRTLSALCDEAKQRGIGLRIFSPYSDFYKNNKKNRAQKPIFDQIRDVKIDGLIIFSEVIKNEGLRNELAMVAREKNIPLVTLKEPIGGSFNIKYDIKQALNDIIVHLIDVHKCKRINFISGTKGFSGAEERLDVYKKIMSERGLAYSDLNILYGDFWSKPTRIALENYFAAGLQLPEAFVCANDAMAIETCNVLKEYGYTIPEDVIVTGMGGLKETEYHFPTVTTGKYGTHATSKCVFEHLERMINRQENWEGEEIIPCGISYSESCGCKPHSVTVQEQKLVDTYTELETERRYSFEIRDLITEVNENCDLEALAEKIPEYVGHPGITAYNIFIRSEIAELTGIEFFGVNSQRKKYMWLSTYSDGKNELMQLPLTMEEVMVNQNRLLSDSSNLISIPLHSDDTYYGFITLGYNNDKVVHELLYELIANINVAIHMIVKRYEFDNVNKQLNILSEQTILSLAEIVEAKSEFTGHHVKRVSEYTRILAEAMDLSEEDVNILRIASMMHDIGKINIPSEILEKPGKLTPEEFDIIKTHVREGERMLKNSPGKLMQTAKTVALMHHEKWNGTGYLGIKGEDIDLYSRIVALADVYDALVSARPYKAAFSADKAYSIIVGDSGSHFDPAVVDAFKRNFDKFIEVMVKYADEEV